MVNITDEEKFNMKRDIACNAKKIDELKQEFDRREPARETEHKLNQFNIEVVRMSEGLKNLEKTIQETNKRLADDLRATNELNEAQHKEILSRIGRIEGFVLGILILFATAAIYFIFVKTGLSIK